MKDKRALSSMGVEHTIRVPAKPSLAFRIFTSGMVEWWDRAMLRDPGTRPGSHPVLEPKAGGRWYERATDGTEDDWGQVLVWEPGARLVVEWTRGGRQTLLELRFESPAPRATVVTLRHTGFEVYGDRADHLRAAYDHGWGGLLQRFAQWVEEQHLLDGAHGERRSARAVTDGDTVLATIDIPVGPERVFRALTTDETEKWWGAPDTYRVTKWASELRVGGRWSLIVVLPDGSLFPSNGTYLEVEPPHRLVLTRRYDFDYPELGRRDTKVSYRLDAISPGTRVTVRQDGFDGLRVAADHHADGWMGFLQYLADYLGTERV